MDETKKKNGGESEKDGKKASNPTIRFLVSLWIFKLQTCKDKLFYDEAGLDFFLFYLLMHSLGVCDGENWLVKA